MLRINGDRGMSKRKGKLGEEILTKESRGLGDILDDACKAIVNVDPSFEEHQKRMEQMREEFNRKKSLYD
jgi:hypothetical protein